MMRCSPVDAPLPTRSDIYNLHRGVNYLLGLTRPAATTYLALNIRGLVSRPRCYYFEIARLQFETKLREKDPKGTITYDD